MILAHNAIIKISNEVFNLIEPSLIYIIAVFLSRNRNLNILGPKHDAAFGDVIVL